MPKPQPWSCADATDEIRAIARSDRMRLTKTNHFSEQMHRRDLIMGDVLYVLKNGFVYADPQPSTQPDLFKYGIDSMCPSSGNRTVRVIVIPDATNV